MCDLFGMSCNEQDRATRSLPALARFAAANPHGWGIGWYEHGIARVERAPVQGDLDPLFWDSIEEAQSEIILGHVRWATGTSLCECNCHPFIRHHRGRDWMMAHNGWVSDYDMHEGTEGDTDSEQIFHEIMDQVEAYQTGGRIRGLYPALKAAIEGVFEKYGRSPRLNLLITDGRALYAFHHYPGKPMYMLRRSKAYGGAMLVSTQRLTDEDWEPIPENRLLVIDGGEVQVISSAI